MRVIRFLQRCKFRILSILCLLTLATVLSRSGLIKYEGKTFPFHGPMGTSKWGQSFENVCQILVVASNSCCSRAQIRVANTRTALASVLGKYLLQQIQ